MKEGQIPLHKAVCSGHVKVVEKLITEATVNAHDLVSVILCILCVHQYLLICHCVMFIFAWLQ